MARPVQYNIYGQTDVKLVKEGPEGYMGEGFSAPASIKWLGSPGRIPSGHCLLQLPAVELNLWQPWVRTMTWPGLGLSG
jgi:hypothetical protein